jgi:hypothetical protein
MTKKVFLSYAWDDHGKVSAVSEKLRQQQKRGDPDITLLDIDLKFEPLRQDVRETIKQTIEESDEVVVLWTVASSSSSYVFYELGMAEALNKPITVVLPGESTPELPANLRGKQVVDLGVSDN